MLTNADPFGRVHLLHAQPECNSTDSSPAADIVATALPSTTAGCRYCLLGRRKGWKTHLSDDCRHHPHRDTRLANRAKYDALTA